MKTTIIWRLLATIPSSTILFMRYGCNLGARCEFRHDPEARDSYYLAKARSNALAAKAAKAAGGSPLPPQSHHRRREVEIRMAAHFSQEEASARMAASRGTGAV